MDCVSRAKFVPSSLYDVMACLIVGKRFLRRKKNDMFACFHLGLEGAYMHILLPPCHLIMFS